MAGEKIKIERTEHGGWIWKKGFDDPNAPRLVKSYLQILDRLHEAASIANKNRRFVYINPAFVKLYEFSAEDVLGEAPDRVSPQTISRGLKETINTKPDGKKYELTNISKHGRTIKISLTNSDLKAGKTWIGALGLSIEREKANDVASLLMDMARKTCREMERKMRQTMSEALNNSLKDAGGVTPSKSLLDAASTLSDIEKEVLHLWEKYQENKAIARHLGIEPGTVGSHKRNALQKLGLTNKTAGEQLLEIRVIMRLLNTSTRVV